VASLGGYMKTYTIMELMDKLEDLAGKCPLAYDTPVQLRDETNTHDEFIVEPNFLKNTILLDPFKD
jgi:hypothetical protein